jgi:Fur family ferric uptake transcriptional regulator
MKRSKGFQELLTRKKLKKTSQRELIWGLLLKSKGHLSVEDIRDVLGGQGHPVGTATVYRTVKLLLDAGLIRQSRIADVMRYEPVVTQPNHLHFVCNDCGKTVEFPSQEIENLIQRVTSEHRFQERYSRYMVSGLCKVCARKEEKTAEVSEKHRREKAAVRDALELTLSIERLGYTFYKHASVKTQNGGGRLMFQRLAAEESDHLRILQREHRELLEECQWLRREPACLPVSRKIARDLFPEKDIMRLQVNERTSEVEAIQIAMELERRSHQFFKKFASELTDAVGRKLFLKFAEEEQSHLDTLRTEYNAITQR